MNKKSMTYWFFIEIVAGVLAAFLLTSVAINFGEGIVFVKTKIARDIALEVNALHAVPGDVTLTYPENLSEFRVEFKGNKVQVYQEIDLVKPSYSFVSFENITYLKDYEEGILEIRKEDNKISLN